MITAFASGDPDGVGGDQQIHLCRLGRNRSVLDLIAIAIPLLIHVLPGRVFCYWICPISFLAVRLTGIRRRIRKKAVLRNRLVLATRKKIAPCHGAR